MKAAYIEKFGGPELHRAGAVRPPPVRLFKLADAAEAVGISKARHLKGKLVFKLR